MTDLWYPITDHHPAPIVQVRAFVEVEHVAAEVIASRGRAPHVDEWVEWRQRVPVRLPRGAVKAWAPQKPESWKAPLPMPLRVSRSDGMWSSTTDLTIVGDAAAAEASPMRWNMIEQTRAEAALRMPTPRKVSLGGETPTRSSTSLSGRSRRGWQRAASCARSRRAGITTD